VENESAALDKQKKTGYKKTDQSVFKNRRQRCPGSVLRKRRPAGM
jgi:hypothetical protein